MKKLHKISTASLILLIVFSGCELSIETVEVYDERNPFIGSYEVEEYSEGSSASFLYEINIWKSRYQDGVIWIGNIYDADIKVFAEVNADRFYIPQQRVGDLEIEGRGSFIGPDELSITYTVREFRPGPDYIDFLNCLAWKQF